MPRVAKGYIEQLPSGSFRVCVYVGTDPLTRRQIRLKATAKTEQQAHIEFGGLVKEASEGRTPESAATVAKLLDETWAALAAVGAGLRDDAHLFSNDPAHSPAVEPRLGHSPGC